MENRRDRDRSRYRRGMASQTASEANRRAGDLYTSTSLKLPKEAKLFQIKTDKPVKLDILPYEVGKGNPFADQGAFHYERTFWVHRGIGPDNASYVCPRETSRGKIPCPVCEHIQKLREDPEADEELIKALKAKRRQLFNVIDVNNPDKGIMIWDVSWHLFGELLVESLEDEEFTEERKDWCEFEGGKTLRLGLKEKTFNKQKFYEVSRIDFVDRKKDYDPEKMLKKVHCLDDIVKVLPYDELKKVFMQTGEDTDGNGTKKFRSSDVQQIKEMDEKELQKFVILNDIDVESDDYPKLKDFQAAVIKKVKEAIAEDGDDDEPKSKKNAKKTGKKKSDDEESEEEETEEETEDAPEIEEGSKVSWTDDDEERTGTVSEVNEKKGTVTIDGDDGETYKKVKLSDLTLVEDEEDEEDEETDDTPEIEKGSEVKWTDDDQDEHEGTVLKIKGDTATVQEGKKKYEVDVSELTVAD